MNNVYDLIQRIIDQIKGGELSVEEIEGTRQRLRKAITYLDTLASQDESSAYPFDAAVLAQLVTDMSGYQDVTHIAQLVVRQIVRLLEMDSGVLIWQRQGNTNWQILAQVGNIDWNKLVVSGKEEEQGEHSFLFNWDELDTSFVHLQFDDASLNSEEHRFLVDHGILTLVVIPIKVKDEIAGVVYAASTQKMIPLAGRRLTLSQALVNLAGILIERIFLYDEGTQRTAQLQALYNASLSLTASLDLSHVLNAILEHTLTLLKGVQDAHIFLYEDNRLKFGAVRWMNGDIQTIWAEPRPDGLTYTVARQGQLIYVEDMQNHPIFEDAPSSWKGSIVGLPLKIGSRVVGVMTVAHEEPHGFSEDDLRILRLFGDQAAIAIENARLHRLANQQAHTDILTGLPNRRALEERLEHEVRRSARYRHLFSLMMLDVDEFKQVNDTFGHPKGDEILRKIAERLSAAVRETDFLARYGGDEFTLLLPETDHETAEKLGERLKSEILKFREEHKFLTQIPLGLSIGLAVFPDDGVRGEDLLQVADYRLYVLKRSIKGNT